MEAPGVVFVLDGGLVAGGAERIAADLLTHWVSAGRRVTLVTMRGPEHDFYSPPSAVRRVVLGGLTASPNRVVGLFRNAQRLWRLRTAVRESGAAVVVSFLTKTNVRTVLACIGLHKRVVLSERNDTSRQRQRWPWDLLRRLVYRHADVVTANSEVGLTSMSGYVARSKLEFVPNQVTVPDVAARPDRSRTILNVGRLVPQKNQSLILEAFARLGEERTGWQVEILGDGPERSSLLHSARTLGIEAAVRLPGLVVDPFPHYASAAVFVLASEFEGTPNALLEAMAQGLPCIVPDSVPGALEHIEPGVTGLVYRGGDTGALAAALSLLLRDPQMRVRLGAASRRRMRQFDRDSVLAIWDQLLFVGHQRLSEWDM